MLRNKWILLAILTLIWGSSFILIKKSLIGLTPLQLAALRTTFTTLILLLSGIRDLRGLSRRDWKWLALSGILGSLLPAILFSTAQTHIQSSLAALLNSLTPFNTFIIAALLYGRRFGWFQIWGLALGIAGSIILVLSSGGTLGGEWQWTLLILASTICYAFNANILQQYLSHLQPLTVTKASFVTIIGPALLLLSFSGFSLDTSSTVQMQSLGYLLVLAFFGTALAKILFNKLIQISSAVFGSLVTYTMPVMALIWGYLDGERISIYHLLGGAVIITGVYLTGRYSRSSNQTANTQNIAD